MLLLTKKELPACPVATTVGLIGNKWKLRIIRELLTGAKRFVDIDIMEVWGNRYETLTGASILGILEPVFTDKKW